MIENMFFLDTEHAGMGGMLTPKIHCFYCVGEITSSAGKFAPNPPPENYPCWLYNKMSLLD